MFRTIPIHGIVTDTFIDRFSLYTKFEIIIKDSSAQLFSNRRSRGVISPILFKQTILAKTIISGDMAINVRDYHGGYVIPAKDL